MLNVLQAHHLVGQEFERPTLTPIWSLATRQMNELGFSFAVQAPPFGTFSREASGKSHSQVLLDKSLLDTNHGAAADGERLGNLLIGVTGFALALITHEQGAGHEIVLGSCPARM